MARSVFDGINRKVKAVDVYRSIPREFTESTQLGGYVSVVAITILAVLFLAEFSSLLAVSPVTRIDISHGEDEQFRVNFNVTFPEISCEWISVDVLDMIGHKKTNITDNSVHKFNMHGSYVASAVRTYDDGPKYGETTDTTKYSSKQHTVPLTKHNFHRVTKEYKVLLVDFWVGWCSHCISLKPIYEHSAEIIQQKLFEDYRDKMGEMNAARRSKWQRDLALATVDCANDLNVDLCREQHIQAFPTVRIFREGSDTAGGFHESYHGERSAEAISSFALKALDDVQAGREFEDDDSYSRKHTRGCRIDGHIKVSRVPGSIIFTPHATGHDFNVEAINMSHIITHLSFGKHYGAALKKIKKKVPDLGGVYAVGDKAHEVEFVSQDEHAMHEHFVKVVPRKFEPSRSKPIEFYEYTINSNSYSSNDGNVPSVKIQYDLSPMQVVVKETRRPIIDGLVGMFAILGGVYTCFMLIEGLLQGAASKIKKQQAGKLT